MGAHGPGLGTGAWHQTMPGLVLPPTPQRAGGWLGSTSADSAPFPSPPARHTLALQNFLRGGTLMAPGPPGPAPARAGRGQAGHGDGQSCCSSGGTRRSLGGTLGRKPPLVLLRLQPLLFPPGRKPRGPRLSQQHWLPQPRTGHPAQHNMAMGTAPPWGYQHTRGVTILGDTTTVLGTALFLDHHHLGDTTVLGSPLF